MLLGVAKNVLDIIVVIFGMPKMLFGKPKMISGVPNMLLVVAKNNLGITFL